MSPTHTPLARASLDPSKYPCINVFLKSLKSHTRTLCALFAQHATELAVLERIFYLNNNQHRPALFWQRIVEARRYSRRLRSLDVPSLVDGLRRSFYGGTVDTSSKLQKGAWTHYPSVSLFKSFLTRVGTCTALLDKTCVRMRAIYHVLTLAMQSGAFLHLIVTLTAIVARIAHLSSAVRSVLSALHTECAHLFATLDHTEAAHNVVSLPPPPQQLDGEDTKVSAPTLGHNRRTVPDTDLDVSVDLGEAVARTPRVTSRPKSTSASPVLPDYLSLEHNATFAPVIGAQRPATIAASATVDHVPPLVPGPSSSSSHVLTVLVKNQNRARQPSSSRTTAKERKEKRPHKPRKPQRDEIDDIFS